MADLLLELFSEEIPARMQAQAARDLERLMVGALSDRGLLFEGIKAFAGPRRLTLAITGLPAQQGDVREELKGPKIDAPQAALDGFLKKTGLTKVQLKVEATPKGEVYIAVIERKGRETPLVLAEILPEIMAKLPWPKSMRWRAGDPVRWVRPLHSILCTFDGEVVPFAFAGVTSGNTTLGHRFLSSGEIAVRRFDDYEAKLKQAYVVLDAGERAEIISHDLKQKAFALGLEPIEDAGLLAEVSGLVEWPVVLIGTIENQFMDMPPEILQTAMRNHQKYFALRDPKSGKMANRFALVANMVTQDGGKEIVAGNERVLRARLSDAKFFWDEDRKHHLVQKLSVLEDITFQARLGTQASRSVRIRSNAGLVAQALHADKNLAWRAGSLCKADLTTGVVREFPELQGVMGKYFALNDGESTEIANAIGDHYRPLGPMDAVPTAPISIAVALADKLDLLACFFEIDERPSGSSDPYALRRAALGAIRIILENEVRIDVSRLIGLSLTTLLSQLKGEQRNALLNRLDDASEGHEGVLNLAALPAVNDHDERRSQIADVQNSVLRFLADRLKVALKEKGTRHDLIDAVFSLGNEDDLVRLVARVEALQAFLKTDDGANLLAGYKRAANILKAEEKKDGKAFPGDVQEKPLTEAAEKSLFAALTKARAAIAPALAKEDFAAAMQQMAHLRGPVDAFFDAVKVNADDKQVRENRLNLLASLRATLHQVADFSRIEG